LASFASPGYELIQRIMRYSRLADKIDPKIGAGRARTTL